MSCPRGGSCRPRIRGTSVAGAQDPISSDKAGALYRYNNSSAYVRGVTLHAQVIERQPRAFLGYHAWQVYHLTQRRGARSPSTDISSTTRVRSRDARLSRQGRQSVPWRLTKSRIASASSGRHTIRSGSEVSAWL